jgi:hypothetical protein
LMHVPGRMYGLIPVPGRMCGLMPVPGRLCSLMPVQYASWLWWIDGRMHKMLFNDAMSTVEIFKVELFWPISGYHPDVNLDSTRRFSVRIACVWAAIRTLSLPKASQEPCCLNERVECVASCDEGKANWLWS